MSPRNLKILLNGNAVSFIDYEYGDILFHGTIFCNEMILMNGINELGLNYEYYLIHKRYYTKHMSNNEIKIIEGTSN